MEDGSNVLPTNANLGKFFEIGDDICPSCKLKVESSIHLFALCPVARPVWFNSKWRLKMDSFGFSLTMDLIQFLFPFLYKCFKPKGRVPNILSHPVWWNLEVEESSAIWRSFSEFWWISFQNLEDFYWVQNLRVTNGPPMSLSPSKQSWSPKPFCC